MLAIQFETNIQITNYSNQLSKTTEAGTFNVHLFLKYIKIIFKKIIENYKKNRSKSLKKTAQLR